MTRQNRILLLGGAIAVFLVGGVIAWRWLDAGPAARDGPQQLALGKTVYDAHCASCHGARLEGQPNWRERQANGRLPAPPHDASGHTWHHPDSALFGMTKHGLAPYAPPGYQSDMPAFGDKLSDAEIRAVLAYIKSQWPPEIRARQAAIDESATARSR